MAKLDSIPAEILHRIASFSSCESVLALFKVNRRFYKNLNDKAVFKAILRNGSGHGVSTPWNCDLITHTTPAFTLAQLALADSKARAWMEGLKEGLKQQPPQNEDSSSQEYLLETEQRFDLVEQLLQNPGRSSHDTTPNSILKWAPQLVALHHPFIIEGDLQDIVTQLQNSLLDYNHDTGGTMAIKFCVAATVLHHGLVAMKEARPGGLEQLRDVLKSKLRGYSTNPPANLACSLICNHYRVSRQIPPPSPYNIPFRDLSDIPIPFSTPAFTQGAHLPVMTSASFIESGEWVGYYSYQMNLEVARWDPPMRGVRFTAQPDVGPFDFVGSGSDNVGNFTLQGSVNGEGVIEMRKTYVQGFYWDWTASMTPFGIVGTWGRGNQAVGHNGHLWLWKREWSQV